MQRFSAVLILVVVATFAIGDSAHPTPTISEQQVKQLVLAHELEVMGLTTNAASLIRQGRTEVALQLLEQRMSSSFASTDELLAAGVRLPPGQSLSLRKSPGRAVDYAVRYGRDALTAPARSVSAKINQ
jgi:hypothetical protein